MDECEKESNKTLFKKMSCFHCNITKRTQKQSKTMRQTGPEDSRRLRLPDF
jgi:hypothetical protein